ncbi:hypothetical protein EPN28_01090 [Patescibacteria group bacterium]|nr:MAG: hypothetical protein EPN28_01090 [Patescibacteria group bacterium]
MYSIRGTHHTDGKDCQLGKCICTWYKSLCNGKCITTMWDSKNCGACGNQCPAGQMCEVGKCSNTCNTAYWPGDLQICGSECMNTTWDPDNCGSCGRKCNGQNIVVRKCTFDCTGDCENGFLDCDDNQFENGCEVDAMNDPNNCGDCGVKCPNACVNGVCK